MWISQLLAVDIAAFFSYVNISVINMKSPGSCCKVASINKDKK